MLDENYTHIITEKRLNEMLDARDEKAYARGYEAGNRDGRFEAESEGSAQVHRAIASILTYRPKTDEIKEPCGCVVNMSDKFTDYCDAHAAQYHEHERMAA